MNRVILLKPRHAGTLLASLKHIIVSLQSGYTVCVLTSMGLEAYKVALTQAAKHEIRYKLLPEGWEKGLSFEEDTDNSIIVKWQKISASTPGETDLIAPSATQPEP